MVVYLTLETLALFGAGIAAVTDLRTHKIPNWLTVSMAAAGLGGSLYLSGWAGLTQSATGLLVGLGVFFIPYMMGGMGGGDVKLMAALGALLGMTRVFWVALYGALWGGLLALIVLFAKKRPDIAGRFIIGLKLVLVSGGKAGKEILLPEENVTEAKRLYIPYGVAIFLGVVTFCILRPVLTGA
jgi:prepilin peptidase CpaA